MIFFISFLNKKQIAVFKNILLLINCQFSWIGESYFTFF